MKIITLVALYCVDFMKQDEDSSSSSPPSTASIASTVHHSTSASFTADSVNSSSSNNMSTNIFSPNHDDVHVQLPATCTQPTQQNLTYNRSVQLLLPQPNARTIQQNMYTPTSAHSDFRHDSCSTEHLTSSSLGSISSLQTSECCPSMLTINDNAELSSQNTTSAFQFHTSSQSKREMFMAGADLSLPAISMGKQDDHDELILLANCAEGTSPLDKDSEHYHDNSNYTNSLFQSSRPTLLHTNTVPYSNTVVYSTLKDYQQYQMHDAASVESSSPYYIPLAQQSETDTSRHFSDSFEEYQ